MPAKRKDEKVLEEERDFVGVYVFPDGATYDGQLWKRDHCAPVRHGNGVFTDVGCVYDGQWRDDVMSGEGTMQFSTGACYVGTFHDNAFNGCGRYTWPDGSHYEGEWRGNLMHGHGSYVDVDGRRWIGRFYNGQGDGLLLEAE